MSTAQLNSAARNGCALRLYRGLLNLVLIVLGFRDFPDHQAFVALAVLVFSQGVNGILVAQNQFFLAQNRTDDLAERKTRHAIVLATGEDRSQHHFWAEVDRRVREEVGPPEESKPWWAQIGLGLMSFGSYLIWDLLTIAAAAAIAG